MSGVAVRRPIARHPPAGDLARQLGIELGDDDGSNLIYVDSFRFLLRAQIDSDECLSPRFLAPAVTPQIRIAMTRRSESGPVPDVDLGAPARNGGSEPRRPILGMRGSIWIRGAGAGSN